MALIPINLNTFIRRLSNSRLYEVGENGTVFVKVGRVAARIPHMTDYKPGTYQVGSSQPKMGEYSISPLFLKAEEANLSLTVKLRHFQQIYELVSSWRRTSGKHAKEIVFSLTPDASSKQMVLKVTCEGIPDEFCNMNLSFPLESQGQHRVFFKFKIRELLDFLFTLKECKNQDAQVKVSYSAHPDREYNDNPIFFTWECYGHEFQVAHQIVSEAEAGNDTPNDEDDGEAPEPGESFLDESGNVKQELVEAASGQPSESTSEPPPVANFDQGRKRQAPKKQTESGDPPQPAA